MSSDKKKWNKAKKDRKNMKITAIMDAAMQVTLVKMRYQI